MKLSAQSYSSILGALKKALGRYQSDKDAHFVTDIHLQPLSESGELVVYDDDEQVLRQLPDLQLGLRHDVHAPAVRPRRHAL